MASVINQIKSGDITYALAHSAYAECATAAATAAKVATICTGNDTTNTNFTLVKGVTVSVKFAETNSAANPTLNVNGTGDKDIYYHNTNISTTQLENDNVYLFTYNGEQWELIGNNQYYVPNIAATQTGLTGTTGSSNTKIATGIGVSNLFIPVATATTPGTTIVYPEKSCTTFSSDCGTCTPLAVQKAAKMFAITRPTSSTTNAVTRFSNTTGDVKNSTILIEDVTNTKDTTKKANVLSIPAEGGKKMVYGYCTDQVDGTSFIGGVFPADATSFPYASGLAIGGTSGNLLWKGARVLDAQDLTSINTSISNVGKRIDPLETKVTSMWNIWSADGTDDTLVNKVEEVISVFNNYPEGTDMVTALAGKSNVGHGHTVSTKNAAPSGHKHTVTVSGTTGTNDGTAVTAVTGYSSFSSGSGSLKSYNASSGGSVQTSSGRVPYIHSLSKSGYTPAGSVIFTNGSAPSMNWNTGTSTDTPYVSGVSGGSAVSSTKKYMKFSAGTTPPKSATFSGTSGTTSKASGNTGSTTPTFTGTAVTSAAASNAVTSEVTPGTANQATGTTAPAFTGSAVTSTAASTATTSSAGSGTANQATGKTTPTFTGTAVTSGASSAANSGSAGGGTASQATGGTAPTFTGTAVTSQGPSTGSTGASSSMLTATSVVDGVLIFSAGTHTHTMSHTHSVTAAGTVASHTHTYTKPAAHTHTIAHTHSVTAAGSVAEHTHTYIQPAAHTHTLEHTHDVTAAGTVASHSHTYVKPAAHTHTMTHTHDVTAAGTISGHTHTLNNHTHTLTPAGSITFTDGTAPSMSFDTQTTTDIPYIADVSGGSAVSATVKYMKFNAGTTPPASATFTGTNSTGVVTGGTTYYLDHVHTGAGLGDPSTASVAPSGHKHTYGSSAALDTTTNSGTAVAAVTAINNSTN